MERTDWLDAGFDSAEARFLMVTAITHHRFNSQIWGELEVGKLYAELAEIELSVRQALRPPQPARREPGRWPFEARPVPPRVEKR
jgi:hypothetical protein